MKSKYTIFQYFNFGIELITNLSLVEWNNSTTVSNSEQNIHKQLPTRVITNVGKIFLVCKTNFFIFLSCHKFLNKLSCKECLTFINLRLLNTYIALKSQIFLNFILYFKKHLLKCFTKILVYWFTKKNSENEKQNELLKYYDTWSHL